MSGTLLVVAGALSRDGRLLLTRRPDGDPLEGYWELPGGKVEAGETPEEAAQLPQLPADRPAVERLARAGGGRFHAAEGSDGTP